MDKKVWGINKMTRYKITILSTVNPNTKLYRYFVYMEKNTIKQNTFLCTVQRKIHGCKICKYKSCLNYFPFITWKWSNISHSRPVHHLKFQSFPRTSCFDATLNLTNCISITQHQSHPVRSHFDYEPFSQCIWRYFHLFWESAAP